MAERKAVNHYYPPDFDPAKHKSINNYVGQHPLRERAKKIKQGILVIRFEMPYNIWCDGCKNHVGMGVRYNAEKSKVGMYYTTPIYKFRMKCHLCDNYIEMKTDPQNCDYVIISGARRKEQRWDPAQNEQIVTDDRDKIKKLATDPMFKLEHESGDKTKIKKALPGLGEIEALQDAKKDDYILNKIARNAFRSEKKQLKAVEQADNALLEKSSLDISLVCEHDDDIKLAGLLKYKSTKTFEDRQKQLRQDIDSKPLFGTSSPKVRTGSDARSLLLGSIRKTSNFTSSESVKSLSSRDLGIVVKAKSSALSQTSTDCGVVTQEMDTVSDRTCNLSNVDSRATCDDCISKTTDDESVDQDFNVSVPSEQRPIVLDSYTNALSSLMQDYTDSDSSGVDQG